MRLKVISVRLVVEAGRGRFVANADFGDGLNVVSARNNQGKTTLLMAILYGLGLEIMLGPGNNMPLKPATYEVVADADGAETPVLSSYVLLEIENGRSERLTIQRWIKHDRFGRDLVRTWRGGKLSNPTDGAPSEDYFTRIAGSATRGAGWHGRLAGFLGWSLPEVATYDGATVPLYVQVFFPLLFVEQTKGWSSIFGNIPRYLPIRDPGRRSVEFLLGLDAYERAHQREVLRGREAELMSEWRAAIAKLQVRLDDVGGRVDGVPKSATVEWPPLVQPALEVIDDGSFIPLDVAMARVRAVLSEIRGDAPRASSVVGEATSQLAQAEARLAQLGAVSVQIDGEARAQREDLALLEERRSALETERYRYADALKLRELGSLQPIAHVDSHCPTCDQLLPPTLHGADVGTPVLSLEANLEVVDEGRAAIRAMLGDAETVYVATREREAAVRQALADARREVRTLKSALTQEAYAPSEAVIARKIRLGDRLDALVSLEEFYDETARQFDAISTELRDVRSRLASLGIGGQSEDDRNKLLALRHSVREQLALYGYKSLAGVDINLDSYLPERENIDLNKGSSATDTVRLVWSYVLGLVEVSRQVSSNHPGFLVMDEPGQHEMEKDSLRQLLSRASLAAESGQQIILATSMPFEEVDALKGEFGFAVQRFTRRVLARTE